MTAAALRLARESAALLDQRARECEDVQQRAAELGAVCDELGHLVAGQISHMRTMAGQMVVALNRLQALRTGDPQPRRGPAGRKRKAMPPAQPVGLVA